MNEPQQQFYSGNRSYHCLNTQMVVDATGIIRYIESGFMGHINDAQTFGQENAKNWIVIFATTVLV